MSREPPADRTAAPVTDDLPPGFYWIRMDGLLPGNSVSLRPFDASL